MAGFRDDPVKLMVIFGRDAGSAVGAGPVGGKESPAVGGWKGVMVGGGGLGGGGTTGQ